MLFEMNQPQTHRGSGFYVGWIRGMLLCNNFLSQCCQPVFSPKVTISTSSSDSRLLLILSFKGPKGSSLTDRQIVDGQLFRYLL